MATQPYCQILLLPPVRPAPLPALTTLLTPPLPCPPHCSLVNATASLSREQTWASRTGTNSGSWHAALCQDSKDAQQTLGKSHNICLSLTSLYS